MNKPEDNSEEPEQDLFGMSIHDVSLAQQVGCVEREVRMRERVYPRRVAEGRMSQKMADDETLKMRAVLDTLCRLTLASLTIDKAEKRT